MLQYYECDIFTIQLLIIICRKISKRKIKIKKKMQFLCSRQISLKALNSVKSHNSCEEYFFNNILKNSKRKVKAFFFFERDVVGRV